MFFIKTHQTVYSELVNFMASKLNLKKADGKGGRRSGEEGKEEKEEEGREEEEEEEGEWEENDIGSIKKKARLSTQWTRKVLLGVSQRLSTKGETSSIYSLVSEADMHSNRNPVW